MWVSAGVFLAIIGFGQGQEFITTIESINTCLSNGSALFGWEISQVPSPFFWRRSGVGDIIRIFNNQVIKVYPYDATGRAEYLGNATFKLNNLMMNDTGTYVCALGSSLTSETYLFVFDLEDCELPAPEVYINGTLVDSYGSLKSDATYEIAVFVPPNHPAAINVSISITDDKSIHEQSFVSKSAENCSLSFEAQEKMTLTVTFSHLATKDAKFQHDFDVENLPTCKSCENGGTCNQATLECICLDGFTGDTCDKGPDDTGAECKWWCILLIVLAVLAILGIIVGLMYHYRVACFRSKCCPGSSNRRRPSTAACSKVDVNDVDRTVTSGSHGNKQDAGNKDSPYRPDGNIPQKGDGSHGLHVPQGVPVTNRDQKRPMPSPGRKTVPPPLEDPERSKKKKKKKNRKSREEE